MVEDVRKLLAGYVDGELTEDERAVFEKALNENPELREELDEFRNLQEVTGMMRYADLPEEVWDSYWASVYRKLERGLGWILLSAGAIVLICFGLYEVFRELFTDPTVPVWAKLGIPGVSVGAVILLISYARERIFAYKRDRYGKVKR